MPRVQSPHFPSLYIYYNENPKPGQFYQPKFGDSLYQIARVAYGIPQPPPAGVVLPRVLLINKSAWNKANCYYRVQSTNCNSPRTDSSFADRQKNFDPGTWLALCPADTQPWVRDAGLPTNYPIIWIPTADSKEPGDIAPPKQTVNTELPQQPLVLNVKVSELTPEGEPVLDLSATQKQAGGTYWGGGGTTTPTLGSNGKGFPWWIVALGGVGVVGLILFMRKDKKGSKAIVPARSMGGLKAKMPRVTVYDNGGETADRYTIVLHGKDWDAGARRGYKMMLGLSSNPSDPQGFSQWTEGHEGKHLGKKIKFSSLPKNVQSHAVVRITQE